MLGSFSKVRHVVVGAAVAGTAALAATGVIAGGTHAEKFDAKTIVVQPIGGDALRVTEYVDVDFGTHDRHGYERLIPNDAGVPTDVEASSPDADATIAQTASVDGRDVSRIRLGSADRTFDGQHRYVLSYTYPDLRLTGGSLSLDLVSPKGGIYPGDEQTDRFEVVVTGLELTDPTCSVGGLDATGGCELVEDSSNGPTVYRAVIGPLEANAGLTISGRITGVGDVASIPVPAVPAHRTEHPGRNALIMAVLGAISGAGVYAWARRRGRNEVFAGGAADAAFGALPPPNVDGTSAPLPPVLLVADTHMVELATIEFVPPKGIDPWEAAALLNERLDDDSVDTWLSGLVGKEAIEITETGSNVQIASGPKRSELNGFDAAMLDRILGISDPYTTGKYDPQFAVAWQTVAREQERRLAASGWWKRMPPTRGSGMSSGSPMTWLIGGVFALIWFGSAITALFGIFRALPAAIVLGLVFPAIVAYFMYRVLLPARSAPGSALALRAESFRRFLHASEGKHVEWAWSHGLLREYSAWAVGLGEAEAWSKALSRADVPAPAQAMVTPMMMPYFGSSMRSSRTAPPPVSTGGGGSSFGGGGGGFSGGGSVGGGGGGGSSGSW